MGVRDSLQEALHHLRAGSPADCVRLCNDILDATPGLTQAMYLRGCAAWETGDIAQSISDLDVVYGNHPENLQSAYYLGRALRVAGQFERALAPLNAALDDDEFALGARYDLATSLARLRRRPEAIEHYEIIMDLQPSNAQVAANLASLLERENRLEESARWVVTSLKFDPANETALMTQATLDRRNGKYAEAAEKLRGLIPRISHPSNQSIAWNHLGQCLEGQERWDEAFAAFSRSNRILKKTHPGALPDRRGPHGLETLARIQEWLTTKPMSGWSEPGAPDSGGIAFLVGFPRSGTTLLDRMLAAHPHIEVLEEKSLFSSLHQDWSRPGTLEALANIKEEQIADARNIYRQEMTRHRRQPQRSLVIDKLPLNLAYLFLIYRLFPQAPVIFLQRSPMDCCISCYFQVFELEASMGYFLDIELTAQYYDAVMQIAALSLGQVGNPVHQIRYEDLVTAPQDQLAALLGFLDLEVLESAQEYRLPGDSASSNTPSYHQVSRPLHTRSIGKWRNYSSQLASSRAILEPWADYFGYRESDTANVPDRDTAH